MNKKTNIIFILTDDQGAWAMHCAGNGDVHTPNLDRIAAQGIRFNNFFCASTESTIITIFLQQICICCQMLCILKRNCFFFITWMSLYLF